MASHQSRLVSLWDIQSQFDHINLSCNRSSQYQSQHYVSHWRFFSILPSKIDNISVQRRQLRPCDSECCSHACHAVRLTFNQPSYSQIRELNDALAFQCQAARHKKYELHCTVCDAHLTLQFSASLCTFGLNLCTNHACTLLKIEQISIVRRNL